MLASTIVTYIFGIFSEAVTSLTSLFLPSHQRSLMDTNPLSVILRSDLDEDAEKFVCLFWSGITSSSISNAERTTILSRFPITSIRVLKKVDSPEHEFLIVEAWDSQDLKERRFILERTVDLEQTHEEEEVEENTINSFFNHPWSENILAAVRSVPPPFLVAGAAAGAAAVADSGYSPAILSLIPVTLAASYLSTSATPSGSYLPQTNPIEPSRKTVPDKFTVPMAKLFQTMSDLAVSRRISDTSEKSKPPKNARANDRWLAGVRTESPEYGLAREERIFTPRNLTLFHIALLAHIVHGESPMYTLFRNQCYWFASTIYDAAKFIDNSISPQFEHLPNSKEHFDRPILDFFRLPFKDYLPEGAGRYLGFRISEVEPVVLSRIVEKFDKMYLEHNDYLNQVFLIPFLLLWFTNLLTDSG
jgi:hypothetical protein